MIDNAPTAANAIKKLFQHSQYTLSIETLEWMGGLDRAAELEEDNIAATLNCFADAFSEEKTPMPDRCQMAMILWGLAARLEATANMINISREARFLADNKNAQATSTTNEQGGAA